MKANSNQAVLKLMASEGAGADVVSGGELERALAAGIPPEQDRLLRRRQDLRRNAPRPRSRHQVLQRRERARTRAPARWSPSIMGMTAPVSVRINPDVDAGTHAKISTGKAENKFGIPYRPRPRGLCAASPSCPTSGRRRRHAYRQPDHRSRALRQRLRACWPNWCATCAPTATTSAMSMSAAASASPITTMRTPRRARRPMPRSSASKIGQLGVYAGARARPADRRQCRHPRHQGRVCEGRRHQLRHRRRGDERPDPPHALRGPSRRAAGDPFQPAADHRRHRRPGLRNRRLSSPRTARCKASRKATCSP